MQVDDFAGHLHRGSESQGKLPKGDGNRFPVNHHKAHLCVHNQPGTQKTIMMYAVNQIRNIVGHEDQRGSQRAHCPGAHGLHVRGGGLLGNHRRRIGRSLAWPAPGLVVTRAMLHGKPAATHLYDPNPGHAGIVEKVETNRHACMFGIARHLPLKIAQSRRRNAVHLGNQGTGG